MSRSPRVEKLTKVCPVNLLTTSSQASLRMEQPSRSQERFQPPRALPMVTPQPKFVRARMNSLDLKRLDRATTKVLPQRRRTQRPKATQARPTHAQAWQPRPVEAMVRHSEPCPRPIDLPKKQAYSLRFVRALSAPASSRSHRRSALSPVSPRCSKAPQAIPAHLKTTAAEASAPAQEEPRHLAMRSRKLVLARQFA